MSSSFPEQTSDIPLPPVTADALSTCGKSNAPSNAFTADCNATSSLATSSNTNGNGYDAVAAAAYYNASYANAIAATSGYHAYYMQMNGLPNHYNNFLNHNTMVSNVYKAAMNNGKSTGNSNVVENFKNGKQDKSRKEENSHQQQDEHENVDDDDDVDDEDDDPTIDKGNGKGTKVNNTLPIWGNEKTMNLNPLVLTNIQNSPYFKVNLYALKTYHEVIDEIWYQVRHLEPWEKGSRRVGGQTGMCGSVRGVGAGGIVSTPFCILYKLYTLRLTRRQVVGLLKHKDSPYIRALGFLYIRYTQPPENLWSWYEPYLEDKEEVDVKAGGGETMTIGQLVRHLMLKLDWFSTLFPRIPVPIQKDIEQKFNEYERSKKCNEDNYDEYDDNDAVNNVNYNDNYENGADEDAYEEKNVRDYRKSDRSSKDRYHEHRSRRRSRSNERRRRSRSRSRSKERRHERMSYRSHRDHRNHHQRRDH